MGGQNSVKAEKRNEPEVFSASFLKHDTWVSDEAAVRQQLRRRFRFRLASDRFRRKSRDHDAGQSRSKEKLLYY